MKMGSSYYINWGSGSEKWSSIKQRFNRTCFLFPLNSQVVTAWFAFSWPALRIYFQKVSPPKSLENPTVFSFYNELLQRDKSKNWKTPRAYFFGPLCCSQENRQCQPQKLPVLQSCKIWLSLVRWGRWRHHYGRLLTFKAFEIKGWNSTLFKRLLCTININQTLRTQTVLLGLLKNNVPVDFLWQIIKRQKEDGVFTWSNVSFPFFSVICLTFEQLHCEPTTDFLKTKTSSSQSAHFTAEILNV